MASHNAVVSSGANLFYFFFEMPGRKDARTPEKPLSVTSNSHFLRITFGCFGLSSRFFIGVEVG